MASGSLVVKVSTAQNTIPIEDATVFIVKSNEAESDTILASRTTGRSGITQPVTIQTPDSSTSKSPGNDDSFMSVDVRIEHPLYYNYYIRGAQIFANVESVQNVALIPLAIPTQSRTETIIVTPQNL